MHFLLEACPVVVVLLFVWNAQLSRSYNALADRVYDLEKRAGLRP